MICRWSIASLLLMLAPTYLFAADCTVSTEDVDFGIYEPMTPSPLDGTGNVEVDCTGGFAFVVVRLAPGRSGAATNRFMTSGSDQLFYNLFTDAARTTVWGDGSGGTGLVVRLKFRGRRVFDIPVYGRVFASQDAVPGFYTDDIVVTVTF